MLTKRNFTRDEWNNLLLFSTSPISALFVVPRISAWLAAPKRWRKRCKNRKKKTKLWRNPGQRRWTWPVLFPQVLHLWTVRLRRKARGYSKLQVHRLDYQGRLVQTQVKIPIPTKRRVLKDGKGMLNFFEIKIRSLWIVRRTLSYAQGDLWQLDTKDIQKIRKLQKIQKMQNPKVEFGHIISEYHHIMLITWRKSSRSWERLVIGNRRMTWRILMWTQLYGVCSSLLHFKPQLISDEMFYKTYDLSRINLRSLWINSFGQLRSWSKIRRRSQVCPRVIGSSRCVENHLYCVIGLFKLWNPKPTSFPTRCCAWGAPAMNQYKPGKKKN